MISVKSYVINAHINWLDDNGKIPYMTCHINENCTVPKEFIGNEFITFNVSAESVTKFMLDPSGMSFYCRFNGKEDHIFIPIENMIMLSSKDQTIRIPLGTPDVSDTRKADVVESKPVTDHVVKPKLVLVTGGAQGDGIPTGKLSLV